MVKKRTVETLHSRISNLEHSVCDLRRELGKVLKRLQAIEKLENCKETEPCHEPKCFENSVFDSLVIEERVESHSYGLVLVSPVNVGMLASSYTMSNFRVSPLFVQHIFCTVPQVFEVVLQDCWLNVNFRTSMVANRVKDVVRSVVISAEFSEYLQSQKEQRYRGVVSVGGRHNA